MTLLRPSDPRLGSSASLFKPFLSDTKLEVYLVRDRTSKNGDYRAPRRRWMKHVISLNVGLGNDAFILILAHELAHYEVHQNSRRRAKPHGHEWKACYSRWLKDLVSSGVFSQEISELCLDHAKNPRASLSSDKKLWTAVSENRYVDGLVPLETLPASSRFLLNGRRVFEKGERRRTRFNCREISSGRIYLVSALAPVKLL